MDSEKIIKDGRRLWSPHGTAEVESIKHLKSPILTPTIQTLLLRFQCLSLVERRSASVIIFSWGARICEKSHLLRIFSQFSERCKLPKQSPVLFSSCFFRLFAGFSSPLGFAPWCNGRLRKKHKLSVIGLFPLWIRAMIDFESLM